MEGIVVVFAPDCTTRHILDEAHDDLFSPIGGAAAIRRASHVDTTDDLLPVAVSQLPPNAKATDWWADMSPVGGPLLGPFLTRTEALKREVEWLYANNIPQVAEAQT